MLVDLTDMTLLDHFLTCVVLSLWGGLFFGALAVSYTLSGAVFQYFVGRK